MKCKKHPYERGVGVCASCLRERLLALIAAQNDLSPEYDWRLDPSPLPPPLIFPRSVSPYVCHRRSVGSGPSPSYFHHHRFFSTPQVGPTAAAPAAERKGHRKFSLLYTIFGYHRSDESKSSGSSSWLSGLILGRRKKKSQPVEKASARPRSFPDRGMSPAKEEEENDSVFSSGYSTESSTGWRRPEPTPTRRAAASARHSRGVSSFAVCLSPLVRPSPNSRQCQAPEAATSGELRAMPFPHNHCRNVSAGATSLVPSRSRKLADFGRFR